MFADFLSLKRGKVMSKKTFYQRFNRNSGYRVELLISHHRAKFKKGLCWWRKLMMLVIGCPVNWSAYAG
ncbi:hypothetical protein MCU_00513 [Bartonella elizabethae Re6043vi]|uniref:Uncharacterized protein n=2 Tax=Bartonella elizabethae TaxID=807 RepID=J0RAA2_BAREL|nr:hypothetical protein MCU_00513 [Bartonella elizabethae Re6043vi]EJF95631.1 hypothetical protein MEE_00868 [Bartonella elizabethae F9251 = ATCC 49927]VEJ41396.1 Uncharacterised protein [Bartonella elizabethae]